jgi:hypothetical protein
MMPHCKAFSTVASASAFWSDWFLWNNKTTTKKNKENNKNDKNNDTKNDK